MVTPTTVRQALGFEEHTRYVEFISEEDLRTMMLQIGYSGPLDKMGQLERPNLRREWSFFFNCITRAFAKKITNWDAIPLDSLQLGYAVLNSVNYDYTKLVLMNIGDKLSESRQTVFFTRFVQMILSFCIPDLVINAEDEIPVFRLHKRLFTDLINRSEERRGRERV